MYSRRQENFELGLYCLVFEPLNRGFRIVHATFGIALNANFHSDQYSYFGYLYIWNDETLLGIAKFQATILKDDWSTGELLIAECAMLEIISLLTKRSTSFEKKAFAYSTI